MICKHCKKEMNFAGAHNTAALCFDCWNEYCNTDNPIDDHKCTAYNHVGTCDDCMVGEEI